MTITTVRDNKNDGKLAKSAICCRCRARSIPFVLMESGPAHPKTAAAFGATLISSKASRTQITSATRSWLLEWIGGEFDPEAFDPVATTKAMKKGLGVGRMRR